MKLTKTDALILVDLQNDFLEGGSLAVSSANTILPNINDYIASFTSSHSHVVATRDWHPEDHCSFMDQGGSWPPHCVAGTSGSDFSNVLNWHDSMCIISKAIEKHKDAYSGFEDTNLAEKLNDEGVVRIFVAGLATDYCVKYTVLDGIRNGFEVYVLEDAIKAVDIQVGDGEKALAEMVSRGAKLMSFNELGS